MLLSAFQPETVENSDMNRSTGPDSHWVRVATVKDIPERGARKFKYNGVNYAVFRSADNGIFVLEDSCPHKGGPLSQGIVHDNCVTCPLHNWVISLESGKAQGADEGHTPCFPVRIIDNDVHVQLVELQTTADNIS